MNGERWAAVILPDRQVLMVGPKCQSMLVSKATLGRSSHSDALIAQRNQKLSVYLDFVHSTLKGIRMEEVKANKKKLSKKDAEKLANLKVEMLSAAVKQCQEKIKAIDESPDGVAEPIHFPTTQDHFETAVALICQGDVADLDVPGLHTFDLREGKYLGMDCFGRKLAFGLRDPQTPSLQIDYPAALALTHKVAFSPESQSDLKSDASAKAAGVTAQEFQAFFDENKMLLGTPQVFQRLFTSKNGSYSEMFTARQVEAILSVYEGQPEFRKVDEDPFHGFSKCHLYFEQLSDQWVQSRMKKVIDATLNMDVCGFQEPQTAFPPNLSFFRTFLRPADRMDLQTFQAALAEHKLWADELAATEKIYGNKTLSGRPQSDFAKAVATRTAAVRAALPHPPKIHFLGVLNGVFAEEDNGEEEEAEGDSFRQHLRSTRKMTRAVTAESLQPSKKSDAGNMNSKRSLKSKTSTRTSTFFQELYPRYVQNYFDTLEGKQFTMSNPRAPQPVVFGPKENEIMEALKKEASGSTLNDAVSLHVTKVFEKSLETPASRGSASGPKTAQSNPVSTPKGTQETAPLISADTQKPKKRVEPIRLPSLKERRQLLAKILAEEEESNRKYHEIKSAKFDVYGNPRDTVPDVPALFKPVTEQKENGDYLLDPIYGHVKGQNAKGQVECFVRPSNFHKFRNYAPHQYLFQSLDKGFRETGTLSYDLGMKTFLCAKDVPPTEDIIVYPNQVDFGRLTDDGCFELKFTIVNVDWVIQKVVVRPPIQAPEISVVYSQEPFAPGLQKTVFVQVDARTLPKGLFVHNVIVETKYRSYKVRVSGLVTAPGEMPAVETKAAPEPVFTTFKPPNHVKPIVQKVRNVLNRQGNPAMVVSMKVQQADGLKGSVSKSGSKHDTDNTVSENLPRLFYDKNFTVG